MMHAVVFRQPRKPDVYVALKGDVLIQVGAVPDPPRIDVAVKDQTVEVRRKQRRVDLT
jgi:hypothetical protein